MNLQWLLAIVALSFSLNLFAQETEIQSTETVEEVSTEAAPVKSSGRVEKIEVTGSHIKRIDIEGPSPILVLDREYLDRSGYNSVADVLRDTTITATGVGRESAGSSISGAATTGLRGFGSDKILVLLNGNRLPKIGGGNSVDLNLIPFQGIERVEILKDGASATYGSDALAGVINFITKKDFDGAAVSMRSSMAEEAGGNRNDISAMYGKNFNKGNILGIYQYRSNQAIKDKDREWSRGGLSGIGSPGSYQPVNSADPTDTGLWRPDPRCPAGQIAPNPINPAASAFCMYDYTPYSWSQPAIEQHSAILNGEYSINEAVKLYSNVIYTQRTSNWQFAPAPDIFEDNTATGGGNFQIPNGVATGPGWGLPVPDGANVRYRLADELGPRSNRDTTDSYGGTIGAKGYYLETWDWDFNVTHGASSIYNHGHSGYADKDVLYALMLSNDFRPFDATGTGDVTAAKHVSEQWIDSSMTVTQFRTSGELAEIFGGVLSSAFGISGSWEDFTERVDEVTQRGSLFGGTGANGQGARNFQSIFSELSYAIGKLELQLAGRFDRYNDFGETFNPKFAFRYIPTKEVMIRGSVGTGFKAPTLTELYSSQGYGYPFFFDPVACAATGTAYDCTEQQYKTLTGGNRNLKEETSFSYNLGTVVQPVRDLSFTFDYWYTEINDAIGLNLNDLMLAEVALGNAALPGYGVEVRRAGGLITEVIAPNINISQQKADGLEFTADYVVKIGGIVINPHIDHSHMLSYLEQPFPGLPMISKLGEAGRPRWRNTSYLKVGFLEDHSVRFTGRTIAGQFKLAHTQDRSDQRMTATYTEYDLDYRYNAFWNGEISFGVKNLFGTDRPLDDTAGFQNRFNSSLYDLVGRLYYLGYTQTF